MKPPDSSASRVRVEALARVGHPHAQPRAPVARAGRCRCRCRCATGPGSSLSSAPIVIVEPGGEYLTALSTSSSSAWPSRARSTSTGAGPWRDVAGAARGRYRGRGPGPLERALDEVVHPHRAELEVEGATGDGREVHELVDHPLEPVDAAGDLVGEADRLAGVGATACGASRRSP